MRKLKIRLIMWLLHTMYLKETKNGETLFSVVGVGSDFPRFLMYTEDVITRIKLNKIRESITE